MYEALVNFVTSTIVAVWMSTAPGEAGLATQFQPVEPLNDGRLACDGGRQWEDPEEPVCAHRTLPCGTLLLVQSVQTGKTAWCRVLDRGPYGALTAEGTWIIKKPGDQETATATWRGVLDVGPRVGRELGLRGRGRVRIWWQRPVRMPRSKGGAT